MREYFLTPLPFQSRGFFDLLTLRSPRTRSILPETSQNLTKVLKATSLFRIEYEGDSKLQKCLSQHRIACILVLFLTVHHAFSSVRTYTLVRIVNKYLRCLKAVKLDFGKTTTEKIGFYFLTYELNQRRIPLVKMVNGVEEVLILLFVAFEYEYLF